MTSIPLAYLEKIQATYPQLSLSSLELNQDGLVNDVVIVNDTIACRFPKQVWAGQALLQEGRVLDLVRPRVEVAVPQYDHLDAAFASYRFLPGVPLTRTLLLRLPVDRQQRVLDELGRFLRQLHSISPEAAEQARVARSGAHHSREQVAALAQRAEAALFPLLMRHQRHWLTELFAPVLEGRLALEFSPTFIHGDLGVYHLLYDGREQRLSGVIDFGTAGIGDPAIDVAALLDQLGESLVLRMVDSAPHIPALLDRARFYMELVGVQWALTGLLQNDRPLLLAHLGGARDVNPVGTQRSPGQV